VTGRVYTAALCRLLRRLERRLRASPRAQLSRVWRHYLRNGYAPPPDELDAAVNNEAMAAAAAGGPGGAFAAGFGGGAADMFGMMTLDGNGNDVDADLLQAQGMGPIEDIPDTSSVAADDERRDPWECDPHDELQRRLTFFVKLK
jgi:hypothetical protein